MEIEYVYAFLYCPCIHESGFITVSLHRTNKGATEAMVEHKRLMKKEHDELYLEYEKEIYFEFGLHESWDVQKIEIKE